MLKNTVEADYPSSNLATTNSCNLIQFIWFPYASVSSSLKWQLVTTLIRMLGGLNELIHEKIFK